MKKWISNGIYVSLTLLLVARAYTHEEGPDPQLTGAPTEFTCAQVDCHGQFNPTLGNNTVATIEGLPASYVPGTTYDLTARVSSASQTTYTQQKGGFELTVKKADRSRGGQLVSIDGAGTKFASSPPATQPQYLSHSAPKLGSDVSWSFRWTAPAAGSGTVRFYMAGNSANGDGDVLGDHIFTNAFTVTEGTAQQPCMGDLDGNKNLDVNDAILVLKEIVTGGVLTADQRAVADVTGDAAIDVSDAVKLLQVTVGLDTSLPQVCPQ